MIDYLIFKNPQTGIWVLFRKTAPLGAKAYSGSPNGGNVQALLNLIPKDQLFYLEVRP